MLLHTCSAELDKWHFMPDFGPVDQASKCWYWIHFIAQQHLTTCKKDEEDELNDRLFFHSYLSLLTLISVKRKSYWETPGVAMVIISHIYINTYLISGSLCTTHIWDWLIIPRTFFRTAHNLVNWYNESIVIAMEPTWFQLQPRSS